MREQCQRDVTVPTLPATHLILIEAAFALGGLESDLDFPSPAGDVDQRLTGNFGAGCVDDVICVFAAVVETAPHQQVMAKPTFLSSGQKQDRIPQTAHDLVQSTISSPRRRASRSR